MVGLPFGVVLGAALIVAIAASHCPSSSSVDPATAQLTSSSYVVTQCVATDIILTGTATTVTITHDSTRCNSTTYVPSGGVTIALLNMPKLGKVIITNVVYSSILLYNSVITATTSVASCSDYVALYLTGIVPASPTSSVEIVLSSISVYRPAGTQCTATLNLRPCHIQVAPGAKNKTAIRICSTPIASGWGDPLFLPISSGTIDISAPLSELTIFNSSSTSPFLGNPGIRFSGALTNMTWNMTSSSMGDIRLLGSFFQCSFVMHAVLTTLFTLPVFINCTVAIVDVKSPTQASIDTVNSTSLTITGFAASTVIIMRMYNSVYVFQRWTVSSLTWNCDFPNDALDFGSFGTDRVVISQTLVINVLGAPRPKSLVLTNLSKMSNGVTITALYASAVVIANVSISGGISPCSSGYSPLSLPGLRLATAATVAFQNVTLISQQTPTTSQSSCPMPTMGLINMLPTVTGIPTAANVSFSFKDCFLSLDYPLNYLSMSSMSAFVMFPPLGPQWSVVATNVRFLVVNAAFSIAWYNLGTSPAFVSMANVTVGYVPFTLPLGNNSQFEACDCVFGNSVWLQASGGSNISLSRVTMATTAQFGPLACGVGLVLSSVVAKSSLAISTLCSPDEVYVDGSTRASPSLLLLSCFLSQQVWSLTEHFATTALPLAVILQHSCSVGSVTPSVLNGTSMVVRDVTLNSLTFTSFTFAALDVYNVTVSNPAWSTCVALNLITFTGVSVPLGGVVRLTNVRLVTTRSPSLCGSAVFPFRGVYITPVFFSGRIVLCGVDATLTWSDSNQPSAILGFLVWEASSGTADRSASGVDVVSSTWTSIGKGATVPSTMFSIKATDPSPLNLRFIDTTATNTASLTAAPLTLGLANASIAPNKPNSLSQGTTISQWQSVFNVSGNIGTIVTLPSRPVVWPTQCFVPVGSGLLQRAPAVCTQVPLWHNVGVANDTTEAYTLAPAKVTATREGNRTQSVVVDHQRHRPSPTRTTVARVTSKTRHVVTTGQPPPPPPPSAAPTTRAPSSAAPHHTQRKSPTLSRSRPIPNATAALTSPLVRGHIDTTAPVQVTASAAVASVVVSILAPSAAARPSRLASVATLPNCGYSMSDPSYTAFPVQVPYVLSGGIGSTQSLLVGSVLLHGALCVLCAAVVLLWGRPCGL